MTNKKGFTLVELLVVIAIIGLLATLAIVALNSARMKARDAKRVGDVKQIQTALELYFNDNGSYPSAATAITLGPANQDDPLVYTDCNDGGAVACDALCSGGAAADNGFMHTCAVTVLMGIVPGDANPGAETTCTAANETGCTYEYTSATASTYSLVFELEGGVGALEGVCTATQSGMTCV
ncbi:MAG: prepilin-type N-terminal cleavage/methylation domain-containing protein [bacterium]